MLNSPDLPEHDEATERLVVARIVRSGPAGAIAVAGIATAIVLATWFAFYLFVFLARAHG
jgi:hypothetical protein